MIKERHKKNNYFEEQLLTEVSQILKDKEQLKQLSLKYQIPEEDILMIALNTSGIKSFNNNFDRGRFVVTFPSGRSYMVALTITNRPLSKFEHTGELVLFNDDPIAKARPIEEDTCTDSYWRRGKKHLTLNSNSRSSCRGCSFCGTYSLSRDDEPLTTPDALRRKAAILQANLGQSLTALESVGIVTGCFPNEEVLLNHLLMIRQVFGEFGFEGEIGYIGSQLTDSTKLKTITTSGPFAYYLTVEAFERRKQLMKSTKASLSLAAGQEILKETKSLGADTSILYIAGLDTLQTMAREFPQYQDILTRLPQIQTFQVYQPDQEQLRIGDAKGIEYFLKTRQLVEKIFPDLRPILGNNYRTLWYTTYDDYQLPKPEL